MMETVIGCPVFCEKNCSTEHHPLLISFLNYTSSHSGDSKSTDEIIKLLDQQLQEYGKSEAIMDPDPSYRFPPVLWACALGNIPLLKLLLSHGYLPTAQHSASLDSGLHRALVCLPLIASQKESIATFKELLPLMKDSLLLKNKDGLSVFVLACKNCDDDVMVNYHHGYVTEMVDFARTEPALLRSLLTSTNNDGQTALHILAKHDRNSRLMKKLIDSQGADLSVRDSTGCTPMDIAVCNGQHLSASILYGQMKKDTVELHQPKGETISESPKHLLTATSAFNEIVSPRSQRTIRPPAHLRESPTMSEKSDTSPSKSFANSCDVSNMKSSDISPMKSCDVLPSYDVSPVKSCDVSLMKSCNVLPSCDVSPLKSCDVTPPVKSCDLSPVNSCNPSQGKSCDVSPVKYCDVSQLKSCDVSPVKSCDIPPVKLCDVSPMKSCDVSPSGDVPPVKSCDVSPVKSCDLSQVNACDVSPVKSCDVSQLKPCDVSPVKSCDIPPVKSCDMSQVKSIDVSAVNLCDMPPVKSCDIENKSCDAPVRSCDKMKSCDLSALKSCDEKPIILPIINKGILNKSGTNPMEKYLIQLSPINKPLTKSFISSTPDQSNMNSTTCDTETSERKTRKRTFSETSLLTEIGNKISPGTKTISHLRKRRKLLDTNHLTKLKKPVDFELPTSLKQLRPGTRAVSPAPRPGTRVVSPAPTLAPETDTSDQMEVGDPIHVEPPVLTPCTSPSPRQQKGPKHAKDKAIWKAYIKYTASKLPKSADFLFGLPAEKLSDALTVCSGLRDALIQFVENMSPTQFGEHPSPETLDLLYMSASELKEMRSIEKEVLSNCSRCYNLGPLESSVEFHTDHTYFASNGFNESRTSPNTYKILSRLEGEDMCGIDDICADDLDEALVDIEREVLANDARQVKIHEDNSVEKDSAANTCKLKEVSPEKTCTHADTTINNGTEAENKTVGDLLSDGVGGNVDQMQMEETCELLMEAETVDENRHDQNTKDVDKETLTNAGHTKHDNTENEKNQDKATSEHRSGTADRKRKKQTTLKNKIDSKTRIRNNRHIRSDIEPGGLSKTLSNSDLKSTKTISEIQTNVDVKTCSKAEILDIQSISNIQFDKMDSENGIQPTLEEQSDTDSSKGEAPSELDTGLDSRQDCDSESEIQASNVHTEPETLCTDVPSAGNDNHNKPTGETLTLILPEGVSTVVLVKNGCKITVTV